MMVVVMVVVVMEILIRMGRVPWVRRVPWVTRMMNWMLRVFRVFRVLVPWLNRMSQVLLDMSHCLSGHNLNPCAPARPGLA